MIPETQTQLLDSYDVKVGDIAVSVKISKKKEEMIPKYEIRITNISPATSIILNRIRDEFISELKFSQVKISEEKEKITLQEKFKEEIKKLIKKYFPTIDEDSFKLIVQYIIQQDLGLGDLEVMLHDPNLEEIVVNNAKENVKVYHRKLGWLDTNVRIPSEDKIRHFATMIAKDIGKEITILDPLLDAHLLSGDRVNATLKPISSFGNTITIRRFRNIPWGITDFILNKTTSPEIAAVIWQAVQYELSTIVSGGTASGKTSFLNAIANFFPPNQRIISIEDTREITLPNCLHWIPLETREPNPEGKGAVTMLDLVVNSLRMRPDRIVVGEIRRKEEAEVLFEAMHTGHSVYGTIHANSAKETITRLTNPPIDIPKAVIPALSMIVVQNRNRRTGLRRTFQIAEILENGDSKVLFQHNPKNDVFYKIAKSTSLMETLNTYTGMTTQELNRDLHQKANILKDMVKRKMTDVNEIGWYMAKYYSEQHEKKPKK